jgi:hypothetical protein
MFKDCLLHFIFVRNILARYVVNYVKFSEYIQVIGIEFSDLTPVEKQLNLI